MRRREFINLIGGAAAWPLAARAQQAMAVVGFLNHGSADAGPSLVTAFRKGLSEVGFVEGQNVSIEYRWANNDFDVLQSMARDLVRRGVAVIATPLSTPASLAAKAATTSIPVVFGIGNDPVQMGLVTSFNRPGGNVTGVSGMSWELGAKRLGLLHELLPAARGFGVVIDPNNRKTAEPFIKEVQMAGATIGRPVEVLPASTNRDIDSLFASLAERKVDGVLITPDQLFLSRRVQIVGLTLRHAEPALFPWREAVEIGGLMSYASSIAEVYRQVGIYTGRILKGEQPGNMPVMQASKFEFVINLQTARVLGVKFSDNLLSLADEVIE